MTHETLILPKNYQSPLGIQETERAIKKIKDFFEKSLARNLDLSRVSAPLFVFPETGLNDNLNGVEQPVSFQVKSIGGKPVEVVHSLAKWKRQALGSYDFQEGKGLYTDMNAIRRDEETDNLHSIYVDQWDWEKHISKAKRTQAYLKELVEKIYQTLKMTELYVVHEYSHIQPVLPETITFVTTQELEDTYPGLTPSQRESAIAKKHGAVFIMEIGGELESGQVHDGRAPDYDDWTLNGDIVFWYPILDQAFEVSSMGIRVDEKTMLSQLKKAKCLERRHLPFHQAVLNQDIPYSVGGGIGQSRLCMFFLKKAHIGEVQASIWPDSMVDQCQKKKIYLL